VADGYVILKSIPKSEGCTLIPVEKWIDSPETMRWLKDCTGRRGMGDEEFIADFTRLTSVDADYKHRWKTIIQALTLS